MSDNTKNIFVIGDLVIDHTIFMRESSNRHKGIVSEPIYEVIRRMDMAGGAANNARVLAVMSAGQTFLWGLLGRSNWGSFRSILERCHAVDEADSNVEFRGVQDETHAQMNTITRLMLVPDSPPNYDKPVPTARFDDYGHLHVADDKRQSVIHALERAHEKHTVDGIVINDLDMNCLTPDIIKKIATFANSQTPPIPLFIDPKRIREKYYDIEGTAILPNLAEWCHLVDQPDKEDTWRANLYRDEKLADMAQLSFRYLGNFRYHIITCGKDGAVLIAPHPERSDCYAVYRFAPHQTRKPACPPQLGCGDVMTAIFALEFSKSKQLPQNALEAFQKANAAVACYRDMSWHRMPSREEVKRAQKVKQRLPVPLAEPSKGMLFLPQNQTVELGEHETTVPGLFSVDAIFKDRLEQLLDDIKNGWKPKLKSIILGAPSGCGKSTIMQALKTALSNLYGIDVVDYLDIEKVDWDDLDAYFQRLVQMRARRTGKLLVMVDEAMKGATGKQLRANGVILLNAAHAHNVRFLFIGVEFQPGKKMPVNSEIESRCVAHYLSGLAERPIDIPYIVASRIFEYTAKSPKPINTVKIEGMFLLAITNATLSNPNPRILCNWVDASCDAALNDWSGKGALKITFKHLPKEAAPSGRQKNDIVSDFTFQRA
jgi:bifunctional ADP-heptose synthase (sugar kinase/adenylyltransferase)